MQETDEMLRLICSRKFLQQTIILLIRRDCSFLIRHSITLHLVRVSRHHLQHLPFEKLSGRVIFAMERPLGYLGRATPEEKYRERPTNKKEDNKQDNEHRNNACECKGGGG